MLLPLLVAAAGSVFGAVLSALTVRAIAITAKINTRIVAILYHDNIYRAGLLDSQRFGGGGGMSDASERKPDNFDWVRERAECCAATMFEKLKMLIASDVEAINEVRKKDAAYISFKFVSGHSERFAVTATHEESFHRSVAFTLYKGEILVTGPDGDGTMFTVTVGLSDEGDCRCRISGQEYDLWQIRKKALEELFFRNFRVS
jgi:hypothetical protein